MDQITGIILTYNEALNIGRTLEALRWLPQVVVVDSLSTDDTVKIAEGFPNARVVQRRFDSHAAQWNFALQETSIQTPWVLALDADHLLTPEVTTEICALPEDGGGAAGFTAEFIYCIEGKRLRGTLYPALTVLYRREQAHYVQEGHTQRLSLHGPTRFLQGRILHDDRKPLDSWLASQIRYSRLETELILGTPWRQLSTANKIRRLGFVAPWLVPLHCLLFKGCLLDGRAGIYYAGQRMLFEVMVALRLLHRFGPGAGRD